MSTPRVDSTDALRHDVVSVEQTIGGQRALLVLGMHRSGTSALAGLLVHLGGCAPQTLMPGDEDNPQGYWESKSFYHFHERLLRAAGTQWAAWTQICPEWQRRAAAGPLGDECRDLIRREFGDAPIFVVKDPRMCRLLPFWLPVLASAGIGAMAAIVVRHPPDVSRSLLRRNALPPTLALLIWIRHVLEAEAETRSIPRTIVRSDDLVAGWPAVASQVASDLGISWPSRSSERDRELSRFMQSGLGSRESDVPTTVAPDALRRLADQADSLLHRERLLDAASAQALDALRREFDMVGAVADDVRATGAIEVDRLERLVAESQAKQGEFRTEIDSLQQRLQDLDKERACLSGRLEDVYASKSWRITAPLRAVLGILKI